MECHTPQEDFLLECVLFSVVIMFNSMLPRIHMQIQTFLEMCRIEPRYMQKIGLMKWQAKKEN
jgi:hypothetical protein